MKITIYQDDHKGKVAGTLQDGIFTKMVRESKHLMRKLDAWGIDGKLFTNVLSSPQCNVIMLKDKDHDKWYLTTPEIMKKRGEWRHYIPYGAQIFLARRYWVQQNDILSADRIKQLLREDHIGA